MSGARRDVWPVAIMFGVVAQRPCLRVHFSEYYYCIVLNARVLLTTSLGLYAL